MWDVGAAGLSYIQANSHVLLHLSKLSVGSLKLCECLVSFARAPLSDGP